TQSPTASYVSDATTLLGLGAKACTPPYSPSWQPLGPKLMLADLSTSLGSIRGIEGAIPPVLGPPAPDPDPWVIDVFRQDGAGPVNAGFEWCHSAEVALGPRQTATLGLAPFSSHDDLHVLNMGTDPARLRVALSYQRDPVDYDLAPGEDLVIPGFTTPAPLPEFRLQLTNLATAGSSLRLTVDVDYGYELTGIGDPNVAPAFSARLI